MYRHCNTVSCLNITLSILNNSCSIKSTIGDSLIIKVSSEPNKLFIKSSLVDSLDIKTYTKISDLNIKSNIITFPIKAFSQVLNPPLNIYCNTICTINKGEFEDNYTYLYCKSGIVYANNNQPIYILK